MFEDAVFKWMTIAEINNSFHLNQLSQDMIQCFSQQSRLPNIHASVFINEISSQNKTGLKPIHEMHIKGTSNLQTDMSQREKMYFLTCATRLRSLIRVFVVCMKSLCIGYHQKCVQWKFRSDCATLQTGLNFHWMHMLNICFLTLRLISFVINVQRNTICYSTICSIWHKTISLMNDWFVAYYAGWSVEFWWYQSMSLKAIIARDSYNEVQNRDLVRRSTKSIFLDLNILWIYCTFQDSQFANEKY